MTAVNQTVVNCIHVCMYTGIIIMNCVFNFLGRRASCICQCVLPTSCRSLVIVNRKHFYPSNIFLVFFSNAVFSQECFPQPNCVGSSFTMSSARECCAGTEEGMSFSEGGTCTFTQCIGEIMPGYTFIWQLLSLCISNTGSVLYFSHCCRAIIIIGTLL